MRHRGWCSVFLVLLLTACSKATTVPPSHYRDPDFGLSYRVHTTDGTTYYVADFTSTDSTLAILRFRQLKKESSPPPPTPFYIPLAQVSSVESIKPSDNVPLVLAAVFLVVIGLSIGFSGLGGGT